MTIGEVVDPVMLPIAVGLAIVAIVLLFFHVGRRYASAPKRVPINLRIDGRAGPIAGKRWLWLAPGVLALATAVLCIALARTPPGADQRTAIALVFLTIAEVAWFAAWQTDRQIEIARKMTYRIPPARTLRALSPILVTIVLAVVVAVRP